jgi:hypothetical protein
MKDFCENPCCENPGAKVVLVSVDKPSDQKRTLCVTCEEAYSWGIQHGTISAQGQPRPHLDRFLKKGGFVILTRNEGDPSKQGPFEAWAYQGPLDLQAARPVTFGVGTSVFDALEALELQLQVNRQHHRPTDLRQQPVSTRLTITTGATLGSGTDAALPGT